MPLQQQVRHHDRGALRAVHIRKDVKKVKIKDEGAKEDPKKSKRIESKITKFTENESQGEI